MSWNSFWVMDLEFSSGLLRQFMEDLDAYVEEVDSTDDGRHLKESLNSMAALVHVFTTVMSCLKSPTSSVSFLPPETSDWLEPLLDAALSSTGKWFDEDFVVACQHATVVLLEKIDGLISKKKDKLTDFLNLNLESFDRFSFGGRAATLRFIHRMYTLANPKMQKTILVHFLDPKGCITGACLSHDDGVMQAASAIYGNLLSSKSVTALQDVYGHVVGLHNASLAFLGIIKGEDKYAGVIASKVQARRAFLFALRTLASLATSSGSVLAMWALDPSIFHLLTNQSGLDNIALAKDEPQLHRTGLRFLAKHTAKHGHFAASSKLLAASSTSSPTSDYLGCILHLQSRLLRKITSLPTASQTELLSWIADTLSALPKENKNVVLKEAKGYWQIADELLKLSTTSDAVAERCLIIFVREIKAWDLDVEEPAHLLAIRAKLAFNLKSTDANLTNLAQEGLQLLPILLPEWAKRQTDLIGDRKKAVHQVNFRSVETNDFKAFAECLLKGPTAAGHNEAKVRDCLELNSPVEESQFDLHSAMMKRKDLRTLWIGLAAAHFCINNKLKTPLGNAQNTLTTIEKVLRSTLKASGQTDVSAVRALLTFHRCMDVVLRNAYDGSALILAAPPKNIATFFSANKKTCLEWLSRLRLDVMSLAHSNGDFTYVVQIGFDCLPKLNEEELVLAATMLAASLARLGDVDGIVGLYAWCRERSASASKKLRWMRSLVDFVAGRKEKGVAGLKAALSNDVPDPCKATLCETILRPQLSLVDVGEYVAMVNQHKAKLSKPRLKKEYFEALKQLGEGVALTEWTDLKEEEEKDKAVTPSEELLMLAHLKVVNVACAQQRNAKQLPSLADKKKIGQELRDSEESLTILSKERDVAGHDSITVAVLAAVNRELQALERGENVKSESVLLNFKANVHSSEVLVALETWCDFLDKFNRLNASDSGKLSALSLEIARRARKEGNPKLASKHLQMALKGATAGSLTDFVKAVDVRAVNLSAESTPLLRQCAKLCFAENQQMAVTATCGLVGGIGGVALYDGLNHDAASRAQLLRVSSRALITLSHWLIDEDTLLDKLYPEAPADLSVDPTATLSDVLLLEQAVAGDLDFLPTVAAASEGDMVVGRLLR